MIEPTASRFWQATLQSGLADAQALRACWDAIPDDKRSPEDIDRRLARQAVQSGVLTLWQAQQLIAGRSGGFKIDRYVLVGLIGQGGMGRVYLARDSRLNRQVALKILSPERVNNPRAIARFHREALVGAQLQHENLVRVYDEGESAGRCYLVMEYIEGKNIGQMIAEGGPIPPAVTARLGLQVALGLEHAQRKGLIHRDVNPYNILVTRDGTAKLTDLGLAIDLADQDRVTRDGATVGTFDYVSPEQARHSHSVDTRSDIYSLGCTLYHMLTGQVPFPSASLPEKLFSHQANDPEPITNLAPGVPQGLADVVTRMMRKAADDRYATPMELAQALEPFADVPHGPDPGASSRSGPRQDASVTLISNPPDGSGGGAGSATGSHPPGPGALAASAAATAPAPAPEAPPPFVPAVPPPEVVEATLGTPASHDDADALVGLGINLNAGSEPTAPPARPAAPEKPRTRPRAAPPPAPVPTDEPTPADDGALVGLGINLNAGPEPARARPAPAPDKPRARATPPPAPVPPPAPPKVVTPPVTFEPPPAEPENSDALFGLGINLGAGPAPPPVQPPAPEKSKAKPKAATAPPPPAPAAPEPPVLFEPPPAEPEAKADEPFGLGINLDPGPAPPPARPAAADRPKPAPKPRAAPPPAPAPPPPAPAPVVFAPPPAAPEAPGDALAGLGIGVNLGPEPSLSQGRPAAKPKPAPKPAPAPQAKPAAPAVPKTPGAGGARPPWAVPAAAGGGVVVLVALALLGYQYFGGGPSSAASGGVKKGGKTVAGADKVKKVKPRGAEPGIHSDLAVVAADGTIENDLPDLGTALRAAVGGRGYVVLSNAAPLKVPAGKQPLLVSGGQLTIRAAAGMTPVLEVEVKGGNAFLSTRTGSPLRIEGVTIVARFTDPGANPAPVIDAGGSVALERCSFRVEGPAAGSRAVAMEGGTLTATGCWFENFDRALDTACFDGTTMTFRQCMFVRTRGGDPNTSPLGWAVHARGLPGGTAKTGRKLVFDHCTARGQGFVDFNGFSTETPVTVDLNGCAVLAESLISWVSPAPPSREAVAWTGVDDQYDIHTPAWVLLGPGKPMPDGPGTLDAWTKAIGPETGAVPPPLKFATDLAFPPPEIQPKDFAVTSQGARPPGADPAFVGPTAKRLGPAPRRS